MVTLTTAMVKEKGTISFDCCNETYAVRFDRVESFVNDLLLKTSDKSSLIFSRIVLSRSMVVLSDFSDRDFNMEHIHQHEALEGVVLDVARLIKLVGYKRGINPDAFSKHIAIVSRKIEEGKNK